MDDRQVWTTLFLITAALVGIAWILTSAVVKPALSPWDHPQEQVVTVTRTVTP